MILISFISFSLSKHQEVFERFSWLLFPRRQHLLWSKLSFVSERETRAIPEVGETVPSCPLEQYWCLIDLESKQAGEQLGFKDDKKLKRTTGLKRP